METKHKDLLNVHRATFIKALEVEKLTPILVEKQALTLEDVEEINKQSTRYARAEKLLDILPERRNSAFQSLCHALERTYPHLLTVMYLSNQRVSTPDSRFSSSLTSDSEDDILTQSSLSENRSPELDGTKKIYTRIIPSHEYDFGPEPHKIAQSQGTKHRHPIMSGDHTIPERHHNYESLKAQCEMAMNELQALKRQHSEMEKRHELVLKEADLMRHKYKVTLDQLHQAQEDKSTLNSQVHQLCMEKQRIEQELKNLQALRADDKQEIQELQRQQREVINESGSSEVLNKMYDNALDKYEDIRKEYDLLREQKSELMSKLSETAGRLEIMQDEKKKLMKQYDSMKMERDSAVMERKALKEQCTVAILNWNAVNEELDQLKDKNLKITQQRDELMKESNKIINLKIREVESAKKDRDAAKKEYELVWAERESVLKEIEQLQNKVTEMTHQLEISEKEKKNFISEQEALRHNVIALKQEKEHVLKEKVDIFNQYSEIHTKLEQIEGHCEKYQKEIQVLTQQRDTARKERQEALIERDKILHENFQREKNQKVKAEEMDQVSKETDFLKRKIEKLKRDYQESVSEVENAKKSRDWALHERQKIVQERDSIRTLCDTLRHERDRAVIDKAKTLRDFDELKKQKSEACKELKETKEKYESVMEKEARKNQLNGIGHNQSRDSAIDADLQELETEEITVELGRLNPDNLGFEIVGGKDDPQVPNDASIYVSFVNKGCSAEGKLKVNDVILKVNNIDTTNIRRQGVLQALRDSSESVSLLIKRRRCITPRVWQPIQINVSLGKETGIYLDQGFYISRINPGSMVAKEGLLVTGDRIVAVNGKSVESMCVKDLMLYLDECCDPILLDIWRQTSFLSSAGSSPTPNTQPPLPSIPDHSLNRSQLSKSDAPLVKSGYDSNVTSDSGKSSTQMQTSGSQTDSLDSPGLTPRHSKMNKEKRYYDSRGSEMEKSRHSMVDNMLEKLKNFHKPRQKPVEKEVDDGTLKADLSPVMYNAEIADHYPSDTMGSGDKDTIGKKHGRKVDLENEASLTWPKRMCTVASDNTGTVVLQYPQKRPNLDSVINPLDRFKVPPQPPERNESSYTAARHSPQSSDSTITSKYRHSPQNSDSTLKQFGGPSPVSSPKVTSKSGQYMPTKVSSGHFSSMDHTDPSLFQSRIPQNEPPSYQSRTTPRPSRDPSKRRTVPNFGDFTVNVKDDYQAHPPVVARKKHWDGGSRSRAHITKPNHLQRSQDSTHFNHSGSAAQDFSTGVGTGSMRWTHHFGPYDSVSSPPPAMPIGPDRMTTSFGSSHTARNHSNSGTTLSSLSQPSPVYFDKTRFPSGGSRHSTPMYPSSPPYSSPSGSTTFTDYEMDLHRYSPTPYHEYCSSPSPSQLTGSSTPSADFSYLGYHNISSPHSRDGFPEHFQFSKHSADSNNPGSPFLTRTHKPVVRHEKPHPGETRNINIEKSALPIGFSIETGKNGGIFVSMVNANSLAAASGLVIGDQILEICGINMRTATRDIAKTFLQQCGQDLTLLVQYNPEEFKSGDSSGESSPNNSPTNSPDSSTFKKRGTRGQSSMSLEKTRQVNLKKSPANSSLGISIVGGNAVGIFVNDVQTSSVAFGRDGLRCGDQILQFNGQDFTSVTAEFAANELSKPMTSVKLVAQYNLEKYKQIKDKPGDFFYVRCHFDRLPENEGELSLHKDDILLIENTMCEETPGTWYAWLLDDDGRKIKSGTIPSKDKLPDEVLLHRSHSGSLSLHDLEDLKSSSRRGSGSARRSFISRFKHKRNNSKDSREFGNPSDGPLNSESVPALDDLSQYAYTKVERMEYKMTRPVILLAPLAEPLINKMISSSPDKYQACHTAKVLQMTAKTMEQGLADGVYIDYWQQDNHYECIQVSTIKEICEQGIHCLLSCSPAAIERLHRLKIYPIVLFVRHKSYKQIREIKDPKFLEEKMTTSAAKDSYHHFQKIEQDFRHQFSAIIQGGNMAEMYQQVKNVIAKEQEKAIWVPVCPLS